MGDLRDLQFLPDMIAQVKVSPKVTGKTVRFCERGVNDL